MVIPHLNQPCKKVEKCLEHLFREGHTQLCLKDLEQDK